jgi:hypothetical protein
MQPKGFALGDRVKIVSKHNGTYGKIGSIYEIINLNGLRQNATPIYPTNTYLGSEIGKFSRQITLYHGDIEFSWSTRKEHAESIMVEIVGLKEMVKSKEKEVEFLLKYKDEEEELAYKIKKILENKDSVKAIAEILRDHKTDLM